MNRLKNPNNVSKERAIAILNGWHNDDFSGKEIAEIANHYNIADRLHYYSAYKVIIDGAELQFGDNYIIGFIRYMLSSDPRMFPEEYTDTADNRLKNFIVKNKQLINGQILKIADTIDDAYGHPVKIMLKNNQY